MLSEGNSNLLRFIVLTDCSAKKQCFVAPRSYVDVKEGVVHWPTSATRPPSPKGEYDAFCFSLVEHEIPPSTEVYPFKNVNYRVICRKHAIKAIYQDFGEYIDVEESMGTSN